MKNRFKHFMLTAAALPLALSAQAQYRNDTIPKESPKDTAKVILTLDDALRVALSENVAVKVADKEIQRTEYAKKGTYASLFPQINASGAYQRTIKKQMMYMDSDSGSDDDGGGFGMLSSIAPYFLRINELSEKAGMDPVKLDSGESSSGGGGFAVGRWNTYNYGFSASMPLVNAQLWESIKISGQGVDLAVEKARSSRLDMVTQVKQAYYAVLLAKEAFNVYKDVYENAVENFGQTEKRYNAQKASELEYTRAKSTVAAAIPDVYNAESSVILALWQLKAVMGVDLDRNIDVSGSLEDFSKEMFRDINENGDPSLEYNTTMRQLAIQAEQLASTVRMQKAAYLPTLAANFSYSMIAMTNDFKFSEYQWSPYSYVGVSLSIPIFSGGKRVSDVRQAKVQATQLDLQRIETERQLKISIRQYLNTMETNMNSFNSATEAVALAQKAYDIAAKSYKVGKSTITELNDARLTLTQSSLAQSQAVYNLVFASAAVMLAACGNGKKSDSASAAQNVEERATLIATATAVRQEVPQTEVYSSSVQAFAVNNIAPQTSGRIKTIKVDVGSFVGKNQLLAEMDASQLDQARLKLVNDSTELARLKSLYEEGGVSKSDYDASEMAWKVSRRSYNNLLENTWLRSPISGVVTARNYDQGDLYSGQAIFVVQQITPVKLLVGISETDYTKVKKGDQVEITADAIPGRTFTGKVNKIYPTIDPTSHTFTTEILVGNTDRTLRPGMYARVKVEFGVNNSIVVPDEAVVKMQGSGQRSVYVVSPDNTVNSVIVKIGRHFDRYYEILEGLNEGDIVATKGSSSLKDGAKVEITKNN